MGRFWIALHADGIPQDSPPPLPASSEGEGAEAPSATSVLAHPHESLQAEQLDRIEHRIMHVREALRGAIAAKDVSKLRALYAPSFTHTHGSPAIETAKVEEPTIRVLHPDTAIVSRRSPILDKAENRDYDYLWMQVWVRVGGEWQLTASQASRVPIVT